MTIWKRICFSFILFPIFSFGQAGSDSIFKPNFSIAVNTFPCVFDDLNLNWEIHFKKSISIGIGGGKIYANEKFNFIVADHANWPGAVYDGYEFKTFIKFYPFRPTNRRTIYFSILYQYVNKSYNKQSFFDTEGRDIMNREITRSESQSQNNYFLLVGKEFNSGHFRIDLFTGIYAKITVKDFTNYYSFTSMQAQHLRNVPLGSFHEMHEYLIPAIGMKVGFCSKKYPISFKLPEIHNYPGEHIEKATDSSDNKHTDIPK